MMHLEAEADPIRLVHLAPVDLAIIVFYFCASRCCRLPVRNIGNPLVLDWRNRTRLHPIVQCREAWRRTCSLRSGPGQFV